MKRLTIIEMRKIAKSRGGKCLSKKYINNKTRLKWQCAKGHVWEITPSDVKNSRHWCPYCAGNAPLKLEEMKALAAKHGGKCLSKLYVNARSKLKWRCFNGHEWEAPPCDIKNSGHWCPYCGMNNVTENICREIFELIFNNKFNKKRPKWLKNSRGNQMELDGYNEGLALAFEYQGEQHFSSLSFFYKNNSKTLKTREADDKRKKQLCEHMGVRLIEIPFGLEIANLYPYILKKCREFSIKIPAHKKVDISLLKSSYHSKDLLELRHIAFKKGGELISDVYLGSFEKLQWRCAKGHEWKAPPSNIRGGHWCPYCYGNTPLSLDEMKVLAAKRGGKCLSREYVNVSTRLKWQCAKGHEWKAKPDNIKSGEWCPYCAKRAPLTLKEMGALAAKHNGKCLSRVYRGNKTNLKWQCAKGHEWKASPSNVKRGTWCPYCAKNKKIWKN